MQALDPRCGAEIDLRSDVTRPGAIHLAHDPWTRGDDFVAWLAAYAAKRPVGPLILNTKEDGLEDVARQHVTEAGITNFFFLDTALPTLVKQTHAGERRFAVRYSSVEPAVFAERFVGLADWLWVDCFGGEPVSMDALLPLKRTFKICLVSPELQGRPSDEIVRFKTLYDISDAVCTKHHQTWRSLFP